MLPHFSCGNTKCLNNYLMDYYEILVQTFMSPLRLRGNCNYFGDALSFHLTPWSGQHFKWSNMLKNTCKYNNIPFFLSCALYLLLGERWWTWSTLHLLYVTLRHCHCENLSMLTFEHLAQSIAMPNKNITELPMRLQTLVNTQIWEWCRSPHLTFGRINVFVCWTIPLTFTQCVIY